MSLIDADTLAFARETMEQLHGTEATHGRMVTTISASGSESKSYTPLGTVMCRVETDMGDQQQASVMGASPSDRPVYEYVVFAAHDADIRTGDRLTLSSGIVLSVIQDSRGQSQGFVSVSYCTEVS